MSFPPPKDYYVEPLENLIEELTPGQRRKLAEWIRLVDHYGRELAVRISSGTGIAERFSDGSESAEKGFEAAKANTAHLRQLFNDLDEAVRPYQQTV